MLDLDAIEAALTEPCVALRLVQTDHGGCLDFDVEDLRVLVAELRAAREVVEAAQAFEIVSLADYLESNRTT